MADAAIELDRLVHRYKDRTALAGLSLSVGKGQIAAFLGPNGSGKTTLFRILTTLMIPSEGTARVAGFDVAREPREVRRRIGVVFQSPSLDRKLTVRENLVHQGHLYGLRGAELARRIDDRLDRVGLVARAGDLVETLSGGLKRRVEIAKGLLHDPEVLLLDEPSAGLDPGARNEVWSILLALKAARQVTALLTTHDMEEAARCEQAAILDGGRLVAFDAPEALTRSLGGRIIRLAPAGDAAAMAARLEADFGITPQVGSGQVVFVHADAVALLARIMSGCGDRIRSAEIRDPTLEDLFLARTGRPFWIEAGTA